MNMEDEIGFALDSQEEFKCRPCIHMDAFRYMCVYLCMYACVCVCGFMCACTCVIDQSCIIVWKGRWWGCAGMYAHTCNF